jgi:hypothetical protein
MRFLYKMIWNSKNRIGCLLRPSGPPQQRFQQGLMGSPQVGRGPWTSVQR